MARFEDDVPTQAHLNVGIGVGTVLGGRYRLEAPIGRGGVGDVWRARHARIGKSFAVKVLHGRGERGSARKRMLREARLLSEIRHPGVVEVIDFDGEADPAFMVMELLEGRTLERALHDDGRMSWPKAAPLLRQLLEGLRAAHEAGIIHRDIKPANVFLVNDDQKAKLIDFGIAGAQKRTRITVAGEVLCTPYFMSPEQARTMALREPSDLYSFACLAYAVLVGRPPYIGTMAEVAQQHLKAPTPRMPRHDGLPRFVRRAIERCLEKDPNLRFQTAEDLLQELFDPARTRRVRTRWVRAAATVGVGMGLVTGVFAVGSTEPRPLAPVAVFPASVFTQPEPSSTASPIHLLRSDPLPTTVAKRAPVHVASLQSSSPNTELANREQNVDSRGPRRARRPRRKQGSAPAKAPQVSSDEAPGNREAAAAPKEAPPPIAGDLKDPFRTQRKNPSAAAQHPDTH